MIDQSVDLNQLIRPMPMAKYEVDYGFNFVEKALEGLSEGSGLNLVPDFQRGHVWTQAQQEKWIEAVVRGAISTSGLMIQFNSPAWDNNGYTGELPKTTECIDGLQRLTAIRKYMGGEICAFGHRVDFYAGTSFDARRYRFRVAVHAFQSRDDLLQYYIDLNAGGTPHSAEEIARVIALKGVAKAVVSATDTTKRASSWMACK